MPTIRLQAHIQADQSRIFDLSRSVNLHTKSTAHTKEQAIGGTTSGLLSLGDYVTWRARHFGVYHSLTSKITAYKYPEYFVDEMQQGIFHSFVHEHIFETVSSGTIMTDIFTYKSPLGILGELADSLFLKQYMT